MTWQLLTVWLGLILIAVAVWPLHHLLVLVPGVSAVVIGLVLKEE